MEKELVAQWDRNKQSLRESFQTDGPSSYDDIFERLFKTVLTDKEYDTSEITAVDHGDYQGTRIFLIHEKTYQPSGSEYLVCEVGYGSCSGCDTYQAIASENYDDKPTEGQIDQYMTLALHMIQGLKPLFS